MRQTPWFDTLHIELDTNYMEIYTTHRITHVIPYNTCETQNTDITHRTTQFSQNTHNICTHKFTQKHLLLHSTEGEDDESNVLMMILMLLSS